MNVLDYTQEAASTAQSAAYDRAYLIPMIVGEVGELFGQRAKAVWHGWDKERLTDELVLEYGDICWGTAILMLLEGTDHSKVDFTKVTALPHRGGVNTLWAGNQPDPWQQLLARSTDLYLYYTQEETHSYLRGAAQQLWLALQTHCQVITGHPFDDVLTANLAKLASRAARGTLVGRGDHR